MSVSYAVDFAALILLGPARDDVRRGGQCVEPVHVPDEDAEPAVPYAVQHGVPGDHGAGRRLCLYGARRRRRGLGAQPRPDGAARSSARPRRISCCNTLLIAVAIGLSTQQTVFRVWNQNFLWSAPSYFVGAGVASSPSGRSSSSGIWIALLLCAPLYLTYRTYKVYLGRIDDERRHVQEMADLHLATIEALALAIDAKDQTAQSHIRRVQVYAAGLAQALGHAGQRDPGRQDRGAAARHRQARRARAHPVEARTADAGRVPEDPRSIRRSAPRSSAPCRFRIRSRR